MRHATSIAALLLVAASACGPARVTRPVQSVTRHGALEQHLEVRVRDPSAADPDWFHLSSRLVNRGTAPMTVRVVTCGLDHKRDLRTRARFMAMAAGSCAPGPDVITLAPGEASPPVGFSGAIEWPGRYTVRVRHALEPEFWATIRITAR